MPFPLVMAVAASPILDGDYSALLGKDFKRTSAGCFQARQAKLLVIEKNSLAKYYAVCDKRSRAGFVKY